jgi:glyoxylase-like metal-dependent hydrolase (beta-lactamase superfamily II)
MVKKFTIGKAEVFSLSIATVQRSFEEVSEIYSSVPTGELEEAVRSLSAAGKSDSMEWAFNAALIRLPGHNILVDTGYGFTTGEPGVGMLQLIQETGISDEEITEVVITHGHGDHVGGLVEEGRPTMPKAQLVIHKAEHQFYMGGEASRVMGEDATRLQQAGFSAYSERTRTVDSDDVIAASGSTGVRAIGAYGHTPGHIGLEVSSQGKRFWLLVDILHALFQLEHTDWVPRYDLDPARARKTRVDLLKRAADEKIPVLLYHLPFPGVGIVRESGEGFSFSAYEAAEL